MANFTKLKADNIVLPKEAKDGLGSLYLCYFLVENYLVIAYKHRM